MRVGCLGFLIPPWGISGVILTLNNRYAESSHWLYYVGGAGGFLGILMMGTPAGITAFFLPAWLIYFSVDTLLQVIFLSFGFAAVRELWDTYNGRNLVRDHYRDKDRKPKDLSKPKYQSALEETTATYKNGVLLGLNAMNGEPVLIDGQSLSQHSSLVGTTGSGKTNTIMTFVEAAVRQGKPLIFIDGKGDPGLATQVGRMAAKFGRAFKVFSFDESNPTSYNPFRSGSPTELKDKFMTLSDWSEEYYRQRASRALQLVFRILQYKGIQTNLRTVAEYLDQDKLKELLQSKTVDQKKVASGDEDFFETLAQDVSEVSPDVKRWLRQIEEQNNTEIAGLQSKLDEWIDSDIGDKLAGIGEDEVDLRTIVDQGGIVLFSLDSLRYPEFARAVGKLVINDLKTVISAKNAKGDKRRVSLIFDEFNVFATPQVVDIINKSRSAGFEALISFQSLADLDAADPALRRQVIQNCNTHIVMRQNDAEDAEDLAKTIGTRETFEVTNQVDHDEGMTGRGSFKEIREFAVHPDKIKDLGIGQAFLLEKNPSGGSKVKFVQVRRM